MLALAGCGSGSGGSSGVKCQKFTDLCEKFPASRVNDLCGTTANGTTGIDLTGSLTPFDVSSCTYGGSTGDMASAERYCFHGGASAATSQYRTDHDATRTGTQIVTELPGVGDKAFYLESLSTNQLSIYVVQGELYVDVKDDVVDPPAADTVKQCLLTLAHEILTAAP